jgi:hypothetical protein
MDPISIAMGLAQFVPSIIKWVSGSDKAEQAAEHVIDIAKVVTGKGDGVDALAAISGNAKLAIDFRKAVLENEADLDKAYLADRADARHRDVELAKAGVQNTRANLMVFMDVVGLMVGLGGMLALGWFKAQHPNEITEGVFGALLAQLSTLTSYFGLCLRDAHQFEFGSSRGSRAKDEAMAFRPPGK